jgi:hypothetical protein
MNQALNDIFDKYFADCEAGHQETERRKLERAQRRAAHDASLHTCGSPRPVIIAGWYSPEQYAKDSAAGLSTD